MGHPVAGEQPLVLAGDGTLEPDQDIDPGGIPGLDGEGGIGAILTAAPGDPLVDDGQLTVIAQIHPTPQGPHQGGQQGIAGRQDPNQPDPRLRHPRPKGGTDQQARAQIIRHGPAGYPPPRRPDQGLRHPGAIAVRQPDVEEQMDPLAGGVDVRHQAGDGVIGIRGQPTLVTAAGPEAADGLTHLKEGVIDRVRPTLLRAP